MLDSPTSAIDTDTFFTLNGEHSNRDDSTFARAGKSNSLFSSKTLSSILAGAANAGARCNTFNDIASTFLNYAPQSEKMLATLRPVERSGYYVPQCMEGTREDIFKNIDQWLDDVGAPNVLWLSGSPGAGKSTIASSLVSRLTRQHRLGSSFFFKGGDVTLSDPAALWRTVAYDLAQSNPKFRKILIWVLEQRKVDPRRPDIATHFQHLILGPLTEIYCHPSSHPIPVILIDALDECDSDRSQAAQRKVLLDTLTQWSHLPGILKLIVTGRDDCVPESFRVICKQITLPTGCDVSADTNNDIRHFFEERFTELGGSSFPEWPGKQILDALTTRAAGLFIWAETVVKFIEQGSPDERLEFVLNGELVGSDNLTKLYQQNLELSFQGVSGRELEATKAILATIILAKVPLHYDDLYDFVSQPKLLIRLILDKLSSVISSGSTGRHLRICHLSFSEFLCDRERCPEPFFIDRGKESQALAMVCFRLMKDGLKFNICDLETSHLFNDDVMDLPVRIKANIPAPLLYSCRFWAAHLEDTMLNREIKKSLVNEVKDFLHTRFLYWLEVLSLTKNIPAANIALLTMVSWIEMFDINLSAFARDASQFILTFAVLISTSTPHIYLSALPFSPHLSLVARQYQSQFPNTLSVVSGLTENWPAKANIFQSPTDAVSSVMFSSDDQRVVSGSADETHLRDAETSEDASQFEGHTKAVVSVTFSPDGKQVVSSSIDKTIRIWNAETGQIVAGPFEGHTEIPMSVGFSPDGKRVVSGSFDKTIRIWDAETGHTILGSFEGHTEEVFSAVFSPNGDRVASSSVDQTVRIWDAETGKITTPPLEGHTKAVISVVFSPNGKQVASASFDKTICIWDTETGEIVTGPFGSHMEAVISVSFSPDGKRLASGSFDKTIRVWDARTGHSITGPFIGHMEEVFSVVFSPDGRQIVSGSADGTVCIWDAETGQIVAGPFEGHTKDVNSVAFSPDGKRVVSGSFDKTIRIWDAETCQIIADHVNHVNSFSFLPNAEPVVSSTDKNEPRMWDAVTPPIWRSQMRSHLDVLASIGGGRNLSPHRIEQSHGWVPLAGNDEDSSEDFNSNVFAFWVPPPCRGGLCGIETLVIFGRQTTRLDLGRFVHGTAWTQCQSPGLDKRINNSGRGTDLELSSSHTDHPTRLSTPIGTPLSESSTLPRPLAHTEPPILSSPHTRRDSSRSEVTEGSLPLDTTDAEDDHSTNKPDNIPDTLSPHTLQLEDLAFIFVPWVAVYCFYKILW